MAYPVITNNTPTGGITWTAFTIRYGNGDGTNGTKAVADYVVAAGSTTNTYVWWTFNNGAPTVGKGDSLPLSEDKGGTWNDQNDMLLFVNKNGVGLFSFTSQVVEGSLIVTGSIVADAIGANQVVATKIASDAIETRHIKAAQIEGGQIKGGQIVGTHIVAGEISAEKLTIGASSSNLCPNPYFEDWTVGASMPQKWAQISSTGYTGATISRESSVVLSGNISLGMVAASGNNAAITTVDLLPVLPGVDVFASFYYAGTQTTGTVTNGVAVAIYYYSAAGALLSAGQQSADVVGNSTIQAAQYVGKSPTNAKFMRPVLISSLTTKVVFDVVEIGNRITGVTIADGAIDGRTVTGATIQTSNVASRGLKLTSAGLYAYDSAGVNTLSVDAVTGALSLKGTITSGSTITGSTFSTAASGRRVTLESGTNSNLIRFYPDDTTAVPGAISSTTVSGFNTLKIAGPTPAQTVDPATSISLESSTSGQRNIAYAAEVHRFTGSIVRVDNVVELTKLSKRNENGYSEIEVTSPMRVAMSNQPYYGTAAFGLYGYDTGWVNLTLRSGYTAQVPCQGRIKDGIYYQKGIVQFTNTNTNIVFGTDYIFADLPSVLSAAAHAGDYITVSGANSGTGRLRFTTNSTLVFTGITSAGGSPTGKYWGIAFPPLVL